MKISFILPALIKVPIGGVKVIYRYARELADLGHDVTIFSPKRESNFLYHIIKSESIKIRDYFHQVKNEPYYKTPNNVEHYIIPEPSHKYISDGDIIIATGWQTAYWVDALPDSKGSKFYFIQNYETYQGNRKIIQNTWKLPLKKIVIAKWLKEVAEKMNETVYGQIPNAIDSSEFYITQSINNRPAHISMLYHRLSIKGGKKGLLSLNNIKSDYPNLEATIFSSRPLSTNIPNWINLEIRPQINRLREIYNSSAIFLHPSQREGWGLPPMEAMACGCAIVAMANDGVKEYITHNQSGLLSPIGNVDSMIENIKYLLNNTDKRYNIAKNGNKKIKEYSWQRNTKQLEKILINSK